MSCPDGAGKGASASWSEGPDSRRTLPRDARLTARARFRETYAKGRRANGRFVALFAVGAPAATSRLGITVTRKFGGAVQRNRIKRRIREIFRNHRAELVPPLDVVVNVRAGALDATLTELEREFLDCFAQIARKLIR